ncbi:MAG: methyltransferase domain-containing protein [Verrucomicrobia bacterium]|nr:MAG: methyltransferase domain-containing protein [Verrucomicrobiota bacterium]
MDSAKPPSSLARRVAGWLADSPLATPGRRLMEANLRDYHLPLSKWGKLAAGSWLILRDYADGRFPPTFEDQQKAYQGEIDYFASIPGSARERMIADHIVKPFWDAHWFGKYAADLARLLRVFEQLGVPPNARLLELGCGCGWMAEFLAIKGYDVTGTTIAPDDVGIGEKRVAALVARGLPDRLRFRVAPMESVDEAVRDVGPFDVVFVFEALHHAFDWRRAIHAAARALRPGGWLVLANEPNRVHTFVSYRVGRLTNTHEIGMSGPELRAELTAAGLPEHRVFQPRFDNRITAHWIAGRRPPA